MLVSHKHSHNKNIKDCRNSVKRGFSYTCNRGAEIATGKYLLFLNNDTVVKNFFIDNFFKAYEMYDNVGIVGCKLLYDDNTIQHGGVLIFPDKKVDHLFRYFPQNYEPSNRFMELSAVTAASLLIRKDLFLELGMFDERFINGFEDLDLCFKAKEAGFKIIYNPEVEIYHLESKTRNSHDENMENAEIITGRWMNKIIPDFWMFDLGYTFKINEDCIFYIEKQDIMKIEECPDATDFLKDIVEREPLEFNAYSKLISIFLKKDDIQSALTFAKSLFQLEPLEKNLVILQNIAEKLSVEDNVVKKFIEEKRKKVIENKKKMRAVARDLLKSGMYKTGIFYAQWLINFIGDYSSYKLFLQYLDFINRNDEEFYQIWKKYRENAEKRMGELKKEKFSCSV